MKKRYEQLTGDSDKQEILSKGFSFLIIRVLGLFAGYLFIIGVTRIYGASVYGLVSLSFALFMIGGIFSRLGLDINLVRFYASSGNWEDKGVFYRVLIKAILASVLLGALLFGLREYICLKLFGKPELLPYIGWTAAALPFWAITRLCGGVLRARKQSRWFAFLNNPGRFLFSFVALMILWAIWDSPLSAIKAHFYAIVVLAFMGLARTIPLLEGVTFRSNVSSWNFLRESFPMMLSSTILVLLGWTDTFVLGIYEQSEEIGVYNVALKIAALTSFSLQAINSILAPKLAEAYELDAMDQFNRQVGFSTRLNFFVTLMVVTAILILHPWILGIFGKGFTGGSNILIVLCIGQLVSSLSGSVGVIMQMTGRQKAYQNFVLLALALNILLNFTLTPAYGGFGAAVATTVSMLTWNVLGAWYLKSKWNITSYYNFR